MKNTLLLVIVLFSVASSSQAQEAQKPSSISLNNPKLPFVYMVFDHIGPGVPEYDSEPPTRVWLRLVNNSSMPISVWVQSIPKGRPSGEIGVADKIGAGDGGICGTYGEQEQEPSVEPLVEPGKKTAKAPKQKIRKSPTRDDPPGCTDPRPTGYAELLEYPLSRVSIPPGKDALFSVPVNHIALSGFWNIEIPFSFEFLPSDTRSNGDPNLGGKFSATVQYSVYDIPKEHYEEFRVAYSLARP
jgi:hypothetical protein